MTLYPILLNLEGEPCIIVGGGEVARRKIEHLLEAGARVSVIARRAHPVIRRWARERRISLLKTDYRPEHLDDNPRLLFACTDDRRTNRRIIADARKRGIDVNCVDDPRSGDFHVPSMVRRGSLLLTVSTGGESPTLSRVICHRLEQQFAPAWGDFTNLLGKLRRRWKTRGESGLTQERTRAIIDSDSFEVLQSEGEPAARRRIERLLRKARTKPARERNPPRPRARKA